MDLWYSHSHESQGIESCSKERSQARLTTLQKNESKSKKSLQSRNNNFSEASLVEIRNSHNHESQPSKGLESGIKEHE